MRTKLVNLCLIKIRELLNKEKEYESDDIVICKE